MKWDVSLTQERGFTWQGQGTSVIAKGSLHDANNRLYGADRITEYFQLGDSLTDLVKRLREANGSFAMVTENEEFLVAATDRLRGFPLYYAHIDGNLLVSDDAEELRQKVGDVEMDPLNKDEYLLMGYVTGSGTLFPSIKQLLPGQYLTYHKRTGLLELDFYYRYQPGNWRTENDDVLMEELDKMHERVFSRLIDSLQGRTAVVPLSGGCDSRLIVIMLRRLGYENVVCLSYGKEGNWESKVSRKVAEFLGYDWHFVPYVRSEWRDWFSSQEKQDFFDFSQCHASMPFIQDLRAVQALQQQGIVPEDAIVLPGHSYDFLAGSIITPEYKERATQSLDALKAAILKDHYYIWGMSPKAKMDKFAPKLAWLDKAGASTPEELLSLCDEWNWQERQAKYLANAVRAFEFLGLEWRLPLWDNEMMEYWTRIDFERRTNRTFYFKYVAQYQADLNDHLQERKVNDDFFDNIEAVVKGNPILFRIFHFMSYNFMYFVYINQINANIPLWKHVLGYLGGARDVKSFIGQALVNHLEKTAKATPTAAV